MSSLEMADSASPAISATVRHALSCRCALFSKHEIDESVPIGIDGGAHRFLLGLVLARDARRFSVAGSFRQALEQLEGSVLERLGHEPVSRVLAGLVSTDAIRHSLE